MSPAATAGYVARRELRIEAKSREATSWIVPVAAAVVLLVGLGAGPEPSLLQRLAPTAVWLVTLLATALVGVSTIRAEREEGCWTLLRSLASSGALMAGKAMGVWVQLAAAWLVTAAAAALALGMAWSLPAVAGGLVGTLGLAPVAVLVGVAIGDVTRRVGLALVLLLPLGMPVVLAGVELVGQGELRWLMLLTGYAALTWTVTWVVFPPLSEE